ncbi:MAG: hypothetical protein ACR2QL_06790 [Woeseiaceae bacterium]
MFRLNKVADVALSGSYAYVTDQ